VRVTHRQAQLALSVVAAIFLSCWALFVYCEIWKPVPSGFALDFHGGTAHITSVTLKGPAEQAGLRAGDRVVSINGFPIVDPAAVAAVTANFDLDHPVHLEIERDAARSVVEFAQPLASWDVWRRSDGPAILTIRIVQLAVLVVAIFVAMRKPRDVVALVGAGFLATMGVFSVAMPYRLATEWRELPAPLAAALIVPALSSAVIGGWLFSFFTVFPRVRVRSRLIWAAAWLPALPGLISYGTYLYDVVGRARPGTEPRLWPRALLAVNTAYVVAGLWTLVHGYRRLTDVNERRRVRMLVVGSLIGSLAGSPVVWVYWQTSAVDLNRSFFSSPLVTFGTFLFLVMPLTFAYAILRHRLFDLSLIVRQGVRHALARRAVYGLVPALLVVLVLDLLAHNDEAMITVLKHRAWIYTAVAAAALLAGSQRQRWLEAIDRRFFRERYDAQRLLRAVADDIRRADAVGTIAPSIAARIEQALHPAFVALMIRGGGGRGYRTLAASNREAAPDTLDDDNKVVALARLLGTAVEITESPDDWLSRKVPAADVRGLRAAGIDLLVPVVPDADGADAFLALGPKRSDEPYTEDDIDLLTAIAESLAARLPRPAADHERFNECPACGACYDYPTERCPTDYVALLPVPAPRLVGGRYRADRRLGQGGMGTVYAAHDTALMRQVAVKMLRSDVLGLEGAPERFRREARTAAAFSHPNVVTVHDFGVDNGFAFLVMELLDGCTLHDALNDESPFDAARALRVLRDVAAAIDAAHARHLIHRDLKPENIFLVRDRDTAKVLDFGIAKFLAPTDATAGPSHSTHAGLLGTPRYMAPEQLRGEEPRISWDLWALAILAHEMLTGVHPFAAVQFASPQSGVAAVVDGVPLGETCRQFFSCALAIDVADRPPTAAAFCAGLEQSIA
jgi:tRNA A-37 threonylcarbamoyl transferase component Bud32